MAELSSEELEKIVKEEDNSIKPMKEFESPEKLYEELIASVRKYHPSTDISQIDCFKFIQRPFLQAEPVSKEMCTRTGRIPFHSRDASFEILSIKFSCYTFR